MQGWCAVSKHVRRYRKKPVVVEAIQLTVDNLQEVSKWIVCCGWSVGVEIGSEFGVRIHISTLEGVMSANVGDYIIRGIDGEFYPCKPSIFAKTYEQVGVSDG